MHTKNIVLSGLQTAGFEAHMQSWMSKRGLRDSINRATATARSGDCCLLVVFLMAHGRAGQLRTDESDGGESEMAINDVMQQFTVNTPSNIPLV